MPRQCSALAAVVALSWSCAGGAPALTDAERQDIVRDVRARVDAFADAQRRLDADAVVSFVHPDFYMYGDGVRTDYATVVAQIQSSLPSLQRFETTWSDIEVTALAHDHALVTMTFRDDIVDATGAVTRQKGPTTFIWRLDDAGWRIAYVHAAHYPVDADLPAAPRR